MDKKLIKETAINSIKEKYDELYPTFFETGRLKITEGSIRYAAGNLVENLLQSIFDSINLFLGEAKIVSKVGSSDFLKMKIDYKGTEFVNDRIQVDRHVFYNGKRIAFIENKTYLDTCYFDRALADFKKIAQSLKQGDIDPLSCEYIVFAGQKAGKNNTFFTYEAEFYNETKYIIDREDGIVPRTFFFLDGTRNSSRPWYKIKHPLNMSALNDFIDLILECLI